MSESSTPSNRPSTLIGSWPDAAGRFGPFGGRFVAETLMGPIEELAAAYERFSADPAFHAELRAELRDFVGRPSPLYHARRLSETVGGAQLWLKREDLNHTGAHKVNNTVGQALLATRMGKTRIIAETGAGQHGVAAATVAARLGLECVVYMGEEDVHRQAPNVYRMRLLGAEVRSVTSGTRTLKDALNEAMRDWVTNIDDTYYIIGTVAGPHPYPQMVRDFNSVIGREAREQIRERAGRLPDAVVACVGGGSNAIGMFHAFLDDPEVELYGVEAAGDGLETGRHAAPLSAGRPGVLHGNRTYLMQDGDGQIEGTHSVSAGLDYPGVGPRARVAQGPRPGRLYLRDRCRDPRRLRASDPDRGHHSRPRAESRPRSCREAGARTFFERHRHGQSVRPRRQGHSHRRRPPGNRGSGRMSRLEARFRALREEGRAALVPFVAAGDPDPEVTRRLLPRLVAAGADIIELGVPFSDPMADGPVIQRAGERALAAGMSLSGVLDIVRGFRENDAGTAVVLMGYLNPIEAMGPARFADEAASAGVDGVIVVDMPPEEGEPLLAALRERGIDPVFLLSPTTSTERMRRIASEGAGFLYYVSLKGITGAGHLDTGAVAEALARVRTVSDLPVGVGFGIADADSARRIAAVADAVVVGSAVVRRVEEALDDPERIPGHVAAFVAELRGAVDAAADEGSGSMSR